MIDLMTDLYADLAYPTRLNPRTHQTYINVHNDRLTAEFTGKGRYCDPGSVQADISAPKECVLYYYEVEIISSDKPSKIVLGFTNRNSRFNRFPGTEACSVGYRGENGQCSGGNAKWEPYGSGYEKGDIVGCGINYVRQCYFFTRNGKYQGDTGKLHHCDSFPTVGLGQHHDTIKCNFVGPFKFDIRAEYRRILVRERQDINAKSIGKISLDDIVELYLLYRGYKNTLEAFKKDRATRCTIRELLPYDRHEPSSTIKREPQLDTDIGKDWTTSTTRRICVNQIHLSDVVLNRFECSLAARNELRNLISAGRILDALTLLHYTCPNVNTASYLYCRVIHQHFIELVLQDRVPEAIAWLRASYDFSLNSQPRFKKLLEDTTAILCHNDVSTSAVIDCYGYRRRLSVAQIVNDLAHGDDVHRNSLRVLIQFITLARKALREKRNNSGPFYTAKEICQPLVKDI
ncbi:Uncharacterized protein BXIN_2994 [Babesia sp. Xinjiang]|uniref:Uncharacterized protein n=1 Tax=Babesia sp. Xinjiang TaxID=462227 RepID=UPI000A23818A|nr:Uncharacterized protein BXIN_2994 [Babesia sp. Xinjiang]ORM39438.1 Uncharacterized protein BXIN_2994 [Babesia sp. Xinjiang]